METILDNATATVLQPFDYQNVETLISWVPSPQKLLFWAGPQFRYPLEASFFKEHIRQVKINPFQLVEGDTHNFMGYGEICSPCEDHCLLCRLIIAPEHRGVGFGRVLVGRMVETGLTVYGCRSISLNVFDRNTSAVVCYESTGFRSIYHMLNYVEFNGESLNLYRMLYEKKEQRFSTDPIRSASP